MELGRVKKDEDYRFQVLNYLYEYNGKFVRLNLMPNPKMIKTNCGIDKYKWLKRDKSFWGRLRLTWFIVIASLRDFNK